MISRPLLLLDRVATLVLALLLVVAGGLGVWWWSGASPFADRTSTASVADTVARDWFPWASFVLGVVLVLLALRWLAAHVRRTGVRDLHLSGSGREGTLVVDGGTVADAAADAFADLLGVVSASGRVTRDRGQVVARIHASIDRRADLREVARQADLVSAQLRQVLGRDDIHCRFELSGTSLVRRIPGVG